MLLFMKAGPRRSRFMPFGVFSDERFHVVEATTASPRGSRPASPPAFELRTLRSRVTREYGAPRPAQTRSHSSPSWAG
jgi:hypothetical protein